MSSSSYRETFQEFDEVLDGVRNHFKKIIVIFIAGFLVGWPLSSVLIESIINKGLSMTNVELQGVEILQVKPLEVFMLNTKIAAIIGAFVVLPFLLYYGYQAANERIARIDLELGFSKKESFAIIILSILLFMTGVLYAYYFMVPLTIKMLVWWTNGFVSETINQNYAVGSFINFVLLLLLAFGITFELPIVVNLSIRSGLISYEGLKSKRKHMYLVLLVLSGLITGPNIISQILVDRKSVV